MSRQISFIHAADLHLDSPFTGLTHVPEHIFKEIRESTFAAFDHLIQIAIERKVDFVLLAGDLFDNEKRSLKAQIRLRKAFEKLQSHHIAVYVSYGNHDHINGNPYPIEYPDNVHIFCDEKVSSFAYSRKNDPLAMIYGFSYENRAMSENKVREYEIADVTVPFHIAILHGSVHTNTDHDVYAPFYISDMAQKHFDYWALGHIHQREILCEDPHIIYPGNIQGRNRKETGERGCFHVILSETDAEISFIPLQAISFHNKVIDISSCARPEQLEPVIWEAILKDEGPIPQLHRAVLKSTTEQCKDWEKEGHIDTIIEIINDTLAYKQNWQYIFHCNVDYISAFSTADMQKGEHFIGELVRQMNQMPVRPFLSELYQHKQARNYLEKLSENQEQAIKDDAQRLLLDELLPDRG